MIWRSFEGTCRKEKARSGKKCEKVVSEKLEMKDNVGVMFVETGEKKEIEDEMTVTGEGAKNIDVKKAIGEAKHMKDIQNTTEEHLRTLAGRLDLDSPAAVLLVPPTLAVRAGAAARTGHGAVERDATRTTAATTAVLGPPQPRPPRRFFETLPLRQANQAVSGWFALPSAIQDALRCGS